MVVVVVVVVREIKESQCYQGSKEGEGNEDDDDFRFEDSQGIFRWKLKEKKVFLRFLYCILTLPAFSYKDEEKEKAKTEIW